MHLDQTREPESSEAGSITASDARNRLGELIDRTLGGERITITRHGKPIAALVSASDLATLDNAA